MGGLGPLATACFIEMVVKMTDARFDYDHIPMVIYNRPSIPDRTSFILGKSSDNPFDKISVIGNELVGQGVDYIAIPCVTAYYFYDELSKQIKVPIIDMINETATHLKENGIRRVGLMATDGTISGGFFKRVLKKHGIDVVHPSNDGQKLLMNIIYNGIKAGKSFSLNDFNIVKKELHDKGADAIILGCTELSVIHRDYNIGADFLDVMEILARKAILLCGGRLKEEYSRLITKTN